MLGRPSLTLLTIGAQVVGGGGKEPESLPAAHDARMFARRGAAAQTHTIVSIISICLYVRVCTHAHMCILD